MIGDYHYITISYYHLVIDCYIMIEDYTHYIVIHINHILVELSKLNPNVQAHCTTTGLSAAVGTG